MSAEVVLMCCPIMDGPAHLVEVLDDPRPDGAVGIRKPYWCPHHQRAFHESEVAMARFRGEVSA